MKITALLLVFILSACTNKGSDEAKQGPTASNIPAAESHYYAMRDGYLYGYEREVSQNESDNGLKANTLLMFRYSGFKHGSYQVYNKDDQLGVITVFECSKPCEFIKISTFVKGLPKPKVEHMRVVEGTVAWSVLSDAAAGNLEPVIVETNNKKSNIWITDEGNLLQSDI